MGRVIYVSVCKRCQKQYCAKLRRSDDAARRSDDAALFRDCVGSSAMHISHVIINEYVMNREERSNWQFNLTICEVVQ
jgi:hypothetical protein